MRRRGILILLLATACPITPPLDAFVCSDDADCAALTGNVCGEDGTCVRGPDASRDDAGAPAEDAGARPDAGGQPDGGQPDGGQPDAGGDAGIVDGGSDGGLDAGAVDSGALDGGASDGGLDAGARDGGLDAGVVDSGALDGGALDGGDLDSGTFDSGTFDAGPCLLPIDQLRMRCGRGLDYSCELTLRGDDAGVSGAEHCVACRIPVARQVIASDDFESADGGCDMGGWFVATDGCVNAVDNCTLTGNAECCSDESFFCTDELGGGRALKADRNCTGTTEEVRLRQNFDFSGWRNVRVCFDIGDSAADGDDGVLIYARDTETFEEQRPLCLLGDRGPDGQLSERRCVNMPALLTNNPWAQIEFIMHSDQLNDVVYVDNIEVTAVPSACPQELVTIEDPLSGCVAGGPDAGAVDGWQVVQGALDCATNWTVCPDGDDVVVADGVTTVLRRTIDTSDMDDQVEICVWWGDDGANGGEAVELTYDTGAGPVQITRREGGGISSDRQCRADPDCEIVSFADPAVLHHSALVLQARLESDGQRVGIDRVEVSGIKRCDLLDLGVSTIELNEKEPGTYNLDVVRGVAGIDVDMVCSVPSSQLTASQRINAP